MDSDSAADAGKVAFRVGSAPSRTIASRSVRIENAIANFNARLNRTGGTGTQASVQGRATQPISQTRQGVSQGGAQTRQGGNQAAQGATSGNTNSTPITRGTSQAPKKSTANSIYEQMHPDGTVMSRTFFDNNGHPFARQDFRHPHFDKVTRQHLQPHEHNMFFNQMGQQVRPDTVRPLPSGYTQWGQSF